MAWKKSETQLRRGRTSLSVIVRIHGTIGRTRRSNSSIWKAYKTQVSKLVYLAVVHLLLVGFRNKLGSDKLMGYFV